MKSLCSERVDDWRQKLSPLGLQCLELTGDSDLSDFSQIHHVQLICTTPVSVEKTVFLLHYSFIVAKVH